MSVITYLYTIHKDTAQFKLSDSCVLAMADLQSLEIIFGFKSTIRCLSEFFEACFRYFLWWRVTIYTMKFLLCPTAELEIHLHQMPFEINPFWRWTARNKLQFCHSTCLNENEENQQKMTTCEPGRVHHWCFVNTNYSHSRSSICSFQKSCGYKGWEEVARSGKRSLCHLQL